MHPFFKTELELGREVYKSIPLGNCNNTYLSKPYRKYLIKASVYWNQKLRTDNTLEIVVIALWLMLPAFIPSPCAALFGGGKPIDGGKIMADGNRILGDGKTIRGFVAGSLCGIALGMALFWAGEIQVFGINLPSFGNSTYSAFIVTSSLAVGSLIGDMSMSFVKRRIGKKRGAPLPGVDQLDFVAGAWVVTIITSSAWFFENFTFSVILAVIIITPLLHITTNIIGYLLGVKKEPW